MTEPAVTTLPARPLPDDVIDRVAKEAAAQVVEHIEAMYPDAARAVAWKSASRSLQGVVRNFMREAGHAAEKGEIEGWLAWARRKRLQSKRRRPYGYR